MNLQLCSPYRKCPFNCPMCIAATDDGEINNVFNLYENNRAEYFYKLAKAIQGKDTVVITGDTEPTLFPEWISNVLKFFQIIGYEGKIELQTKNYCLSYFCHEWYNLDLDLIAYSATCAKDLQKIFSLNLAKESYCRVRLVVLLTEETIDCLYKTPVKELTKFAEITFKVLQTPEREAEANYVKEHNSYDKQKLNAIIEFIQFHSSKCSIRIDENCMDATDRYEIMRIDGKMYKTWF